MLRQHQFLFDARLIFYSFTRARLVLALREDLLYQVDCDLAHAIFFIKEDAFEMLLIASFSATLSKLMALSTLTHFSNFDINSNLFLLCSINATVDFIVLSAFV